MLNDHRQIAGTDSFKIIWNGKTTLTAGGFSDGNRQGMVEDAVLDMTAADLFSEQIKAAVDEFPAVKVNARGRYHIDCVQMNTESAAVHIVQ